MLNTHPELTTPAYPSITDSIVGAPLYHSSINLKALSFTRYFQTEAK